MNEAKVSYSVHGELAMWTDPITKMGGEKFSYQIPTYEGIKGTARSNYWKPTFIWVIDRVRIMNPIRTQMVGEKLRKYNSSGCDLSYYTFLRDVLYQVEAHIEWNYQRPDLQIDRIAKKHFSIAQRMISRGGRKDVFLGTRDCQAYVEPCVFGEGAGYYDGLDELSFGIMFHGFDYPTETGKTDKNGNPDEGGDNYLHARFWNPVMKNGVIEFCRPSDCKIRRLIGKKSVNHPECSVEEE
jgi:CRISPR-associated protein Cas5d